VQSGSDPVLRRMRRDYAVEEYLGRHARLLEARPGIAITTDFIVGFPGETDADFEASLALLAHARFDNSFSFVFSSRPHTGAALRLGSSAEWAEVPREVATERLLRLQTLQRDVARERMRLELGRSVEVLVEGPSGGEPGQAVGRTPENRVVHFSTAGRDVPAGALVRVRIARAGGNSLGGEIAA